MEEATESTNSRGWAFLGKALSGERTGVAVGGVCRTMKLPDSCSQDLLAIFETTKVPYDSKDM